MRFALGILVALLLAPGAFAQSPDCPIRRGSSEMNNASRACFLSLLEVDDDPLEEGRSVSSMGVISIAMTEGIASDHGFIATQDKATGVWLISAAFYTDSADLLQHRQVNFGSPLRVVPLIVTDLKHACSPTPCRRREFSTAMMSAADVQFLLDGERLQPFRVVSKSGVRVDGVFVRAELEAVIEKAGLQSQFRLQAEPSALPADATPSERRAALAAGTQ